MQIDKLQIELRPRSNAQALDLGFALLRSHASAAYLAFLALWLPLIALCALLTWLVPAIGAGSLLLAWWCKPMIERAPLYVLSRQVFGDSVTWQEAVRAWPRQLGGGWFRLLTWGRLIAAGRSLYQPVWQLEHARGKVASARRTVLARERTGQAAFWFGIVCAHLEGVLQFGLFGLIGVFISDSKVSNPFALAMMAGGPDALWFDLLSLGLYAIAAAAVAPVYTACGFTLYLNRRATLEAWDLELKLRQITPPASARARSGSAALAAGPLPLLAALLPSLSALLFALGAALPPPAMAGAAAAPAAPTAAALPQSAPCKPPEGAIPAVRGPVQGADQARVRAQVDAIYAGADLRGYECVQTWVARNKQQDDEDKKKKPTPGPDLQLLAAILKVVLIAAALGLVGWLLYQHRDKLPQFARRRAALAATEVGGLDIRAESLPEDVSATVRALWAEGRQRAALALLYRATLSRLVSRHGLALRQGDTEGDCVRLCRRACEQHTLSREHLDISIATTALWLDGAYGQRWPDHATVLARCAQWDAQFGHGRAVAP